MQDYCGLFSESGLMPKRYLARFPVTENALIQPGGILHLITKTALSFSRFFCKFMDNKIIKVGYTVYF